MKKLKEFLKSKKLVAILSGVGVLVAVQFFNVDKKAAEDFAASCSKNVNP